MADPFGSDGRLSASGLHRIAGEALGARRHIPGGSLNGYTTPGGAVFVPEPVVQAAVGTIYTGTIGSSYNVGSTATLLNTGFFINLPAGTFLVMAQVTAQLNTNTSGAYCYLDAMLQVTAGTGAFNPTSTTSYVVFTPGPNSGAGSAPTIFNWGTSPIVTTLTATTAVTVSLMVDVPLATSFVAAVVWGTGGGAGQTNLVAIQIG